MSIVSYCLDVSATVVPGVVSGEEGMVQARLPSGATFPVHREELDYFTERVGLYLNQNHFPNISDLQDVDRLLVQELMVYRWGTWLSRQRNWWGEAIDDDKLQKSLNAYSTELRQLKKQLGLDKATRDKEKGEDSVAAYLKNLVLRAREFGVMREDQLGKALELFQQMRALVTLHHNCDDIERREMHLTTEDIIEWLDTVAFPEFEAIDAVLQGASTKALGQASVDASWRPLRPERLSPGDELGRQDHPHSPDLPVWPAHGQRGQQVDLGAGARWRPGANGSSAA